MPRRARMDDAHLATNRALWNGWTRLHERSAFYDVDAFRAGRSTLQPTELREVGPVAGRTLLHLQCHFGLDTLSWARLGARVVGVDLADEAVALAERLSAETGLADGAAFVRANVYDLPGALPAVVPQRYDVVFTSYGVLGWLPDLAGWAEVVARCLAPRGVFHLVEFHPLLAALGPDGRTLAAPYFHDPTPTLVEERGSYAAPGAAFSHPAYGWAHSVGDVVTALAGAGLRVEFVREFPYTHYGGWVPFLEERAPGEWRVRGPGPDVPLMLAVRATHLA